MLVLFLLQNLLQKQMQQLKSVPYYLFQEAKMQQLKSVSYYLFQEAKEAASPHSRIISKF